jgi:uncharacterized protein DUF3658
LLDAAAMTPRWQKMAMVVGNASTRCQELALPIAAEVLAARIQVLAGSGRLEGKGDLRRWRHSEIRRQG